MYIKMDFYAGIFYRNRENCGKAVYKKCNK